MRVCVGDRPRVCVCGVSAFTLDERGRQVVKLEPWIGLAGRLARAGQVKMEGRPGSLSVAPTVPSPCLGASWWVVMVENRLHLMMCSGACAPHDRLPVETNHHFPARAR